MTFEEFKRKLRKTRRVYVSAKNGFGVQTTKRFLFDYARIGGVFVRFSDEVCIVGGDYSELVEPQAKEGGAR